jgi:hypothetical protein
MSWHCSRALVAAFSEATCSDGAQSALLSTTHTPEAFYWPDKTTEHSRLSRFGMTSEPLTADLGEAVLTWFREASLAKTSVLRAKEMGSMGSEVGCGRKWLGLLARYDPVMRGWKTPQRSLVEGLEEYSETWPRWGSMRNGESYQRETWELGTSERGFGSWLPTIGKNEYRGASSKRYRGSVHFRGAKMSEGLRTCETDPTYLHPWFGEHAMGWPLTWTELVPLETAKFLQWQQQHGGF